MIPSVHIPPNAIQDICQRYDIAELAVFGSALRDDFRADSDVDFLVTFRSGATLGPWLHRLTDLENELSSLVGRDVDVVDRKGVEKSRNWIIRKSILENAEVIYGA